MAPDLPMLRAAKETLATRDSFAAGRDFEAVELVEIDVVEAYRHLLRDGSPRLRQGLLSAALEYATPV